MTTILFFHCEACCIFYNVNIFALAFHLNENVHRMFFVNYSHLKENRIQLNMANSVNQCTTANILKPNLR